MRFEIDPNHAPDHLVELERLAAEVASRLTRIPLSPDGAITGESTPDDAGVEVEHEALRVVLEVLELVGSLESFNLTAAVALISRVLRAAADEIDRQSASIAP